jgi:anti-anti-sigma regulatory factor
MSNNEEIVSLEFQIKFKGDAVIVKPVEKTFTHQQAAEFNRIFDLLREQGHTRFILDYSTCEYISSEGLTCTASCWKWCHEEKKGNMVAIVPLDPRNEVRNLFEIIGLSRMIGSALQPTLPQALKYLREFA